MNNPIELLRPDLQGFAGYRSARCDTQSGEVWLNANESPRGSGADPDGSWRRYPDPQPAALVDALAALYGCCPSQLLLGRGSDEAIDLLVRAFCRPGTDAIVVTRPAFGMYAACARIQGARVLEVPLLDTGEDFRVDLQRMADTALDGGARLVFLASPGNPAGECPPPEAILKLAQALSGRALLVLDEAYIEYADSASLVPRLAGCPNLAILRTLSKAHALASARVGCLLAGAGIIAALRRIQAPYPVPGPSASMALRALSPGVVARMRRTVAQVRRERERMRDCLLATPDVVGVYRSEANFLLARFQDPEAALRRLLRAGVVVRDVRSLPQLADALRITVGTPAQNAGVVAALRAREPA